MLILTFREGQGIIYLLSDATSQSAFSYSILGEHRWKDYDHLLPIDLESTFLLFFQVLRRSPEF